MSKSDVLLVIDVQQDFCPGGALAVPDGDAVIAPVNQLIDRFDRIVLTQDWHPPGHRSFASSHPGSGLFDTVRLHYGSQTLWPDHCVQGTPGAEFHPELLTDKADLILRKGSHPEIDSYSAFFENDRKTPTGLAGYLREHQLRRIVIVGLALDYCVRYSAEDARIAGFEVVVLEDACRAIDLGGSLADARAAMRQSGVMGMTSADFTEREMGCS